MKKLLLAPFLLASMFSFGGELKANPYSRYETNSSRLNISDPTRLNKNQLSKQYSLRMGFVHLLPDGNGDKSLYVTSAFTGLSEDFFQDLSSCLSAKRKLKDFILSQPPGPELGRKLKFYGSLLQQKEAMLVIIQSQNIINFN